MIDLKIFLNQRFLSKSLCYLNTVNQTRICYIWYCKTLIKYSTLRKQMYTIVIRANYVACLFRGMFSTYFCQNTLINIGFHSCNVTNAISCEINISFARHNTILDYSTTNILFLYTNGLTVIYTPLHS